MSTKAKILIASVMFLAIAPIFPASAVGGSQGIKLRNAVIATIDSNTKIITAIKGGQTYTIDASSATVRRRYGAKANFSEMVVGDYIWVWGTQSGNSITARKVKDYSIQKWKGSFTGTITAVDAETYADYLGSYQKFTLQSRHRGLQEVRVYGNTVIKYRGTAKTFAELLANYEITAKGIWNNTHSFVYGTSWVKIRKL